MSRFSALGRLLNRPNFTAFTGVVLIALCIANYRAYCAGAAPDLPRWNWNEHQKAVLVDYHNDCGCSAAFPNVVIAATARDFEVVVVSRAQDQVGLKWLQKVKGVTVLPPLSEATLTKINPTHKTVALRIHRGRVVSASAITALPNTFYD